MRIDRLTLINHPPIKSFDATLTSNIVIIAGANGSGKSRLKEAIVQTFRSPSNATASLVLSATRAEEEAAWGGRTIDAIPGSENRQLEHYLNTRRKLDVYVGSIVQIDSDRSVQQVQFSALSLST